MIGSLAGISLGFSDPENGCGAGFHLSKPSAIDLELMTSEGHRVQLRKNARAAVVRINTALISAAEILEVSYDGLQEALDILGARTMQFLSVPNAGYEHLVWWRDQDEIIARWCDAVRLNSRVEVSWVKTSRDGAVARSSDRPWPRWHESMRYLRYSQLRDDLYAAYREAFLAMESVLSTITPQLRGERERAWLVRACQELETLGLDFRSVTPSGIDSIEEFVDDQYKAKRCALFHAKADQRHFLPGVLADGKVVASAMDRLGGFLKQSLNLVFETNSLVGSLTFQGMEATADGLASELELAVSDDRAMATPEDTEINPSGGVVTFLETNYLGVVDGIGYDFRFAGEVRVPKMGSSTIYTTASRTQTALITRGDVEELDVSGADRFQYYLVISFSDRAGLRGGFDL